MTAPAIVWFRQDLRLGDNPAMSEAIQSGADIIPIYILDDQNAAPWNPGAASRWWLHHSLNSLNQSLSGHLACYKGGAETVLETLIKTTGAKNVYWNRGYEPWLVDRDTRIKSTLERSGISVKTFNASLLYEPWAIKKDDGTPYRVFTPFFRRGCANAGHPPAPLPAPRKIQLADCPPSALPVSALNLLPGGFRWDKKLETYWSIGEQAAQARLDNFLDHGLAGYKTGRDIPGIEKVSRLSPYLHFGEISPRTIWHAVQKRMIADGIESDGDTFLKELGWREFSNSLLYYNKDLPESPLQKRFDAFPWNKDNDALRQWQKGQTGYPIVDAGMRQLWETGWMHNRVRMIVGSFLVKDLRIHWTSGEKWFWDCLVDADLANNAASWQWIAGCGADAAPYFRIFNPVTQGIKFDPKGDYIRKFVPELEKLPDEFIHCPWEAPPLVLKEAGVTLGKTYPLPIVDHKKARELALKAFQETK